MYVIFNHFQYPTSSHTSADNETYSIALARLTAFTPLQFLSYGREEVLQLVALLPHSSPRPRRLRRNLVAQQLQQPNNLPIFSTSRNRYPMNLLVPDWHFLTVQLIVEGSSDASGSFVRCIIWYISGCCSSVSLIDMVLA